MKKLMWSALTSLGVMAVPTMSVLAATHTVTQGESLYTIARDNHVSLSAVESANPGVDPENLQIGSTVDVPTGNYTIQPGDTLWKLSRSHGVSIASTLAANPGVDPYNLQPGQLVTVPAPSSLSQTAPTRAQQMTVHATTKSSAASSQTSVSSSSLLWMARLIEAEASGESFKAKVAVGDVVLHRVQSPEYPNTVKGVIFQISDGHYQFTPVMNGQINNTPSADSVKAAKEVLYQGVDYVRGAFVFFTPSKTPSSSWVWNQPRVAQIDNFIFAK